MSESLINTLDEFNLEDELIDEVGDVVDQLAKQKEKESVEITQGEKTITVEYNVMMPDVEYISVDLFGRDLNNFISNPTETSEQIKQQLKILDYSTDILAEKQDIEDYKQMSIEEDEIIYLDEETNKIVKVYPSSVEEEKYVCDYGANKIVTEHPCWFAYSLVQKSFDWSWIRSDEVVDHIDN